MSHFCHLKDDVTRCELYKKDLPEDMHRYIYVHRSVLKSIYSPSISRKYVIKHNLEYYCLK